MSEARRPIRVLHVITRMIVGGAQENTLLSCALVARPRFQSELLTGPETGAEGSLFAEIRGRGVPLHVEPWLFREIHPFKEAVALIRLWRFLRRERFDIVHTHSSKAGILGRVAARMAGVPHVVHTVHGWGFTPGQPKSMNRLYVWLERWCAGMCEALVVVSNVDRDRGLALGIGSPGQYRRIRSGIEVEAYLDPAMTREQARTAIGVPAGAFVVGSVGRLSEQKAPFDLLAAFVPVARARAEAHLVVVGDGPLRAEVETRVRAAGLEGRVHLTGLRRDVPGLMRAFDVFALASRWEGLPRVFPQAMAAGLPIVATHVDGAAEAVEPGVNGFLVEVGDGAGLSGRLLALADDPALRSRMGAAGRARVDEFSATRMVRELEALYSALVGPQKLAS